MALMRKFSTVQPTWVKDWVRIYDDLRVHKPHTLGQFLSSLRWEHLREESRKLPPIPHYTPVAR
jgi:hypothetical protein